MYFKLCICKLKTNIRNLYGVQDLKAITIQSRMFLDKKSYVLCLRNVSHMLKKDQVVYFDNNLVN